MWQFWQVIPSLAAGEARYSSQTVSSLMPGWTATWWQATQSSDFTIMSDWMAVWCIRIHFLSPSAGLSGSSRVTRIPFSLALVIALRPPRLSKGPNTGSWIGPGVIRRAPLVLP